MNERFAYVSKIKGLYSFIKPFTMLITKDLCLFRKRFSCWYDKVLNDENHALNPGVYHKRTEGFMSIFTKTYGLLTNWFLVIAQSVNDRYNR